MGWICTCFQFHCFAQGKGFHTLKGCPEILQEEKASLLFCHVLFSKLLGATV